MKKARFIFFSLLAALAWTVAVILLTRTTPITLKIGCGDVSGYISLVETIDGKIVESEPKMLTTGLVRFSISRETSDFHFRLQSKNGRVAFPLEGIMFYGVTLLTPRNIPHFQAVDALYSKIPDAGKPLLISCPSESVFNLPNVFPMATRLVRSATLVTAVTPLIFLTIFWICFRLGRDILNSLDKILSKPIVFIPILVCGLILLLPNPVCPISPSLDGSWLWLYNQFSFSGAIGRDFVFTYGPLGFLIMPQVFLTNVVFGIVVNAVFLITSGWVFCTLFRYSRSQSERCCVYLLMIVWFTQWPNGMEWRWCAIAVATTGLASFGSRLGNTERIALFVVAAVLAAIQSFVKFSNCVSVVSQQVIFLITYAVLNRRSALRGCVAYFVVLFVSFALGASLLFPSVGAFIDWIHGSVEISSGYNLYMCAEKPFVDFIAPFAVIISLPFVWWVYRRDRVRRAMIWLSIVPLVFCAYKYAVVRQGAEPLLLLVAFLSILLAALDVAFRRNAFVISGICILLLLGTKVILYGQLNPIGFSADYVWRTVNYAAAQHDAHAQEVENLANARLPRTFLDAIGTNGVMNIGADYGTAMTGDYKVIPFPATQNYSAYTPYLERKCLERLSDPTRPVEFVLMPANPQTFDSRNACLDNLRLWYYVRNHYAMVGVAQGQILLHRRTVHRSEVSTEDKLSLRYTRKELLFGLIFRVPRIMARIRYEDGNECIYAVNPLTIDGVTRPPYIPRTEDDVRSFFSEDSLKLHRVASISFERY